MNRTVLIVEDEPDLARLIRDYLSSDGFATKVAPDGESGLAMALEDQVDLVILDLMLPKLDGFEVCRRLRAQRDIPILILSARREDGDKIRGLGLGADDYVTKPFSPAELLARVRSQFAHYNRLKGEGRVAEDRWVEDGPLSVNFILKLVRKEGKERPLTLKEFELLALFMKNPGRVFSKEELYGQIWGGEPFCDLKTVTVHVHRLREKLGENGSGTEYIETVWGMGYRWHLPIRLPE